ncbi:M42 family metallopeptidase [uncultured Ruthenibacterium sp.]|uniref:M42 family metallopeptidase n=1 Tax=uncultured Ruthenibacterium sp. TaxID=1905347 RepID=UPI00349EC545
MPNLENCEKISNAFGPSGYEHEVSDLVTSLLGDCSVRRDGMQNVYASLPQNSGKPLVMLDAHLDEVGFMIQSITANGLLKLVPLGGWVEHNIPAHTFLIRNNRGETIRAISTSKPPHFMSAAEKSAPLSLDNIFLDAGVCSYEDATVLLGLEPGLVAVPDVQFSYCEKTGIMLGKAFDCRLGCAGLVEVMNRLKNADLNIDLTAAFSTQEEVGLRGAKITAERLRPRLAICLEGTPADDTFTAPAQAQGALKKGVQIRYRDGSMVAHPGFVALARSIAQQNNIPHQMAVRTSGGTNGGSIHLAPGGVPTLVLGIPVRYAHTHYGYSAAADMDAAVELACSILQALTPELVDKLNPEI